MHFLHFLATFSLMPISPWMAVFLQLRISVEIQTTNQMDHTASHRILALNGSTVMCQSAKVIPMSMKQKCMSIVTLCYNAKALMHLLPPAGCCEACIRASLTDIIL